MKKIITDTERLTFLDRSNLRFWSDPETRRWYATNPQRWTVGGTSIRRAIDAAIKAERK
jgi:hypothetical protein